MNTSLRQLQLLIKERKMLLLSVLRSWMASMMEQIRLRKRLLSSQLSRYKNSRCRDLGKTGSALQIASGLVSLELLQKLP